jgi:hypothetical protein
VLITSVLISLILNNIDKTEPYQYKIELLDEDYVRLMNADGRQLKITTLDSLDYYILVDNN